jgi:hypothetical protein
MVTQHFPKQLLFDFIEQLDDNCYRQFNIDININNIAQGSMTVPAALNAMYVFANERQESIAMFQRLRLRSQK